MEIKLKYRMAYPITTSLKEFNPHIINDSSEAVFAINLYNYLFYISDSGELLPGLVKDFLINNNSVTLSIRNDIKTIDGHILNANDVHQSLKQIIYNKKHTHGDLNLFIDVKDDLAIKHSPKDNTVTIKVKSKKRVPFLLKLLASCDFAIIPQETLHQSKDYQLKNTGGPYYVKEIDSNGIPLLAANPNHFFYNTKMIKNIQLVDSIAHDSNQLFKENKVDIIPTIDVISLDLLDTYASKANYDIHYTEKIRLFLIKTTPHGQKRLSKEERIYYGQKIKQMVTEAYKHTESTNQLFPSLGSGKISAEKENLYTNKINKILSSDIKNRVTLHLSSKMLKKIEPIYKKFEISQITTSKKHSISENENKADFYITGTDAAFYEDLSLLNYNFKMGTFGNKISSKDWINSYLDLEQQEDRLNKIRELHLNTLLEGFVTPVKFMTYEALSRGIKLNQMKYFAGMQFWKMRVMD